MRSDARQLPQASANPTKATAPRLNRTHFQRRSNKAKPPAAKPKTAQSHTEGKAAMCCSAARLSNVMALAPPKTQGPSGLAGWGKSGVGR
jgi:hypothetical protein